MIAYAQEHVAAAESFLGKLEAAILIPLMALMMGAAILIFLWGVFEFIASTANEKGKEDGKKHMLWGIIGLVIMVSAYSIMRIVGNTFGIDIDNP